MSRYSFRDGTGYEYHKPPKSNEAGKIAAAVAGIVVLGLFFLAAIVLWGCA